MKRHILAAFNAMKLTVMWFDEVQLMCNFFVNASKQFRQLILKVLGRILIDRFEFFSAIFGELFQQNIFEVLYDKWGEKINSNLN